MNKKKWLTLSLIGTALLLIPRRSSRQTHPSANRLFNEQSRASDQNANDTQSKQMAQNKNGAQ
ncbi:hypothetical protein ACS8E3_03885 [Psychrobacter sp. 2Y5]|uniref:hypothetical protein n=1 Tax=unclassified Psychrobacter TaxID=196806 RepID=UPI003F48F43C